jgi:hypothetical protein
LRKRFFFSATPSSWWRRVFCCKWADGIRGGAANGGVTALTGDYGYEPNGVLHDKTDFPEPTELYFTNSGPLQFLTDDHQPGFVLDVTMLEELAQSAPIAA